VVEACAAVAAGVNVLLRILAREVNIVTWFAKMVRACHAHVTIMNVKSARITCVPECNFFHNVRIWGRLCAPLRGHAALRGITIHISAESCWGRGRVGRGKCTAHSLGKTPRRELGLLRATVTYGRSHVHCILVDILSLALQEPEH
jgi:hypothetical protein